MRYLLSQCLMKLFLCVSSEEFLTVAKPIHESGFLQNKKEKEREGKLNEWKDTQELVLFGDFFFFDCSLSFKLSVHSIANHCPCFSA